MRLRTFEAGSMHEAMTRVRDELGADAVIVSSEVAAAGVRLTAALEAPIEPRLQVASIEGLDPERIRTALLYHGVPGLIASRLAAIARASGNDNEVGALASALEATVRFEPIGARPGRPIMLVGPPGAGKTVTTAKLAARAMLDGIEAHLVSCDIQRACGVEQLELYARIIAAKCRAADDETALARAVAEAAAEALVLIDTRGTNPYDGAEIHELRRLGLAVDAEPVLVQAAGSDPLEADDVARAFAAAGARRVILTKLDTTRRFGAVLGAADGVLALTDIGISPFIGDGLWPLSATALARMLLGDPTEPMSRSRAEMFANAR